MLWINFVYTVIVDATQNSFENKNSLTLPVSQSATRQTVNNKTTSEHLSEQTKAPLKKERKEEMATSSFSPDSPYTRDLPLHPSDFRKLSFDIFAKKEMHQGKTPLMKKVLFYINFRNTFQTALKG